MDSINDGATAEISLKSSFQDIVGKRTFVDKSLFIKDFILGTSSHIMINRPDQWGKTFNLSMAEQFLSVQLDSSGEIKEPKDFGVFEGLRIVTKDIVLLEDIAFLIEHSHQIKKKLSDKEIDLYPLFNYFYQARYPGFSEDLSDNPQAQYTALSRLLSVIEEVFTIPSDQESTCMLGSLSQQLEALKSNQTKKYQYFLVRSTFGLCCRYYRQYPVINVSFQSSQELGQQPIEPKLHVRTAISAAFKKHSYLLNLYEQSQISNTETIQVKSQSALAKTDFTKYLQGKKDLDESLVFLSQCLFYRFKKPCILFIDDFDSPIFDAFFSGQQQCKEIISMMDTILRNCIKSIRFIRKSIVTGIIRVRLSGFLSFWWMHEEYNVLNVKFADKFGFTQEEVIKLVKTLFPADSAEQNKLMLEEIREIYSCYRGGGMPLYNPWSILSWLKSQKQYVEQPSVLNLQLQNLLIECYQKNTSKDQVNEILQTETISFRPEEEIYLANVKPEHGRAFLTLLLNVGYLTLAHPKLQKANSNDYYKFTKPNKAIKEIYTKKLFPAFFKIWLEEQYKLGENVERLTETIFEIGSIKEELKVCVLDKINNQFDLSDQDLQTLLMTWFHCNKSHRIVLDNERERINDQQQQQWHQQKHHQSQIGCMFLPIDGSSDNVAVIQELKTSRLSCYQEDLKNMLWQILARRYLESVSDGQDGIQGAKWESVIIRTLVFFKENAAWHVEIEEYSFTLEEVNLLLHAFTNFEREKISTLEFKEGQKNKIMSSKQQQRQSRKLELVNNSEVLSGLEGSFEQIQEARTEWLVQHNRRVHGHKHHKIHEQYSKMTTSQLVHSLTNSPNSQFSRVCCSSTMDMKLKQKGLLQDYNNQEQNQFQLFDSLRYQQSVGLTKMKGFIDVSNFENHRNFFQTKIIQWLPWILPLKMSKCNFKSLICIARNRAHFR